jgi:uncharacterized membrane protein HdeD (DUF308 family)
MTLADKLTLWAVSLIVGLVAIVLFLLRNNRPHYEWLEYLVRKPFSSRQRVALVITLLIGMFVVLSIVVRMLTQRPAA